SSDHAHMGLITRSPAPRVGPHWLATLTPRTDAPGRSFARFARITGLFEEVREGHPSTQCALQSLSAELEPFLDGHQQEVRRVEQVANVGLGGLGDGIRLVHDRMTEVIQSPDTVEAQRELFAGPRRRRRTA